jgi:tRNA modification GTPase
VEAIIELGGVPVRLLDTAGIDVPRDSVEAEGIRRSRGAMAESDLLLVVVDGSRPLAREVLDETACRARVVVRGKSDLPGDPSTAHIDGALDVSALTGAGIDRLVHRLCREVETRSDGDGGGVVASLRQMEGLETLERALGEAGRALGAVPVEAALVDLRAALVEVSALLGVDVGDAVLDRIFATFCLGK